MRIAVDISLYPLHEGYLAPIKDVIARLERHTDVDVRVNRMSTQIVGEYERVMAVLTEELQPSLDASHQSVFVIKLLNADRADF